MYKVCGLDDSYPKNITFEKEYEDWTESQDKAVQLLEDGARSQSQTLMLCDMWCEWKDLAIKRGLNKKTVDEAIEDPWAEGGAEINEQLLEFVTPYD